MSFGIYNQDNILSTTLDLILDRLDLHGVVCLESSRYSHPIHVWISSRCHLEEEDDFLILDDLYLIVGDSIYKMCHRKEAREFLTYLLQEKKYTLPGCKFVSFELI